ncbi:FIG00978812: hypothetical protein [Burkholderia singularis]|uniref:Uncharacterized protein YtcA n=2 Tax=Burkholderia singularis TaxID=1503053 RepID=A0A238H4R8_9BURK|nr:FIG00978812: hypothetical protein [Burkholderia singularis]
MTTAGQPAGVIIADLAGLRRLSDPSNSTIHMKKTMLNPFVRIGSACVLVVPLEGCATRGAPSFALFGAYFPLWLVSALIGVAGAIVAHRVFVSTGWAQTVPFQLSVCTAIGFVIAVFVWLIGSGQLS